MLVTEGQGDQPDAQARMFKLIRMPRPVWISFGEGCWRLDVFCT